MSLCRRFVTASFTHIVSNPHPAPGAAVIVPISQTRKLRFRKVPVTHVAIRSPNVHLQSPCSGTYISALPTPLLVRTVQFPQKSLEPPEDTGGGRGPDYRSP